MGKKTYKPRPQRTPREAELLSVTETAEIFGITPRWLYQLIKDGQAPIRPRFLGPTIKFSRRDVERFVAGDDGVAS